MKIFFGGGGGGGGGGTTLFQRIFTHGKTGPKPKAELHMLAGNI